jgi:ribosomal 50S subunit-associated protein YjgA (DUF615 family)
MNTDDENRAVQQVAEHLVEKFPQVDRTQIESLVREKHEALQGNPIRDFVPRLVEHGAKEQLRHEVGEQHWRAR